jgi:hypothetical protein
MPKAGHMTPAMFEGGTGKAFSGDGKRARAVLDANGSGNQMLPVNTPTGILPDESGGVRRLGLTGIQPDGRGGMRPGTGGPVGIVPDESGGPRLRSVRALADEMYPNGGRRRGKL